MTLIAAAERLTALASEASSAGDASSTDAALREVLDRLGKAAGAVAYGVAGDPWWEVVPDEDQRLLVASAEAASKAVTPLVDAPDEVLAAYARGGDGASRGALHGLVRAVHAHADTLRRAQDRILAAWVNDLWPVEERSRLEVAALMPASRADAIAVLDAISELEGDIRDGRVLSGAALTTRHDAVDAAKRRAEEMRGHSIPTGVLTFFDSTGGGGEVSLASLPAEVLAWLHEHDAPGLFVIRRRP